MRRPAFSNGLAGPYRLPWRPSVWARPCLLCRLRCAAVAAAFPLLSDQCVDGQFGHVH